LAPSSGLKGKPNKQVICITLMYTILYIYDVYKIFQKGTMFTGIRLFNRFPRVRLRTKDHGVCFFIQSLSKDRISFKNNLFSYLMNNLILYSS
jgi:hypothetical protein